MYKKLILIIILISGLISCSTNSFDEELRIAIINNDIEKVKSILEQVNTNINIEPAVNSGLFEASENGNLEIVKYLIEKREKLYPEVLEYERKLKNTDGYDLLEDEDDGRDAYTLLIMCAIRNGHLEIAKYFIGEKRANINADSGVYHINADGEIYYGNTFLMLASEDGNLEIVKYLVENGADINAKNEEGDTALMWAIRTYREADYYVGEDELEDYTLQTFETIRFLIYNGANVNIKNKDGYTPLSLSEGLPKLTKLLKDNGAY